MVEGEKRLSYHWELFEGEQRAQCNPIESSPFWGASQRCHLFFEREMALTNLLMLRHDVPNYGLLFMIRFDLGCQMRQHIWGLGVGGV